MFERSLTEIDKIFPSNLSSKLTFVEWQERERIFLNIFSLDIEPLVDICFKKSFESVPKYSKFEYINFGPNHPLIFELRIRPQNNYYISLQKEIPRPDNQEGPGATGIKLSISIYRSVTRDNLIFPSCIVIEFKIWGHEERNGFISFFKNYRRSVELLLTKLNLDFSTACWFKNLEKYKGNDIIKKIDLYLANKHDAEANFLIEKSFNKNADPDIIIKIFTNLLVLYHCCFGYCKKDKELDRLLDLSGIC